MLGQYRIVAKIGAGGMGVVYRAHDSKLRRDVALKVLPGDIARSAIEREIIPIGERHFRRAVTEFLTHYHREQNHQGLHNALIAGAPPTGAGRVDRQARLGGLLNDYRRAA